MRLPFIITKYNPELEHAAHQETYRLDVSRGMTVLDALIRIKNELDGRAKFFEKDFFDLTREKTIRDYIRRLKKQQVIVAGCETDVCVLQSCLGLLDLGYEVYAIEDLLFSGSPNVEAALARIKSAGAVFLTYKTLYYELTAAVDGAPVPDDLPDTAI